MKIIQWIPFILPVVVCVNVCKDCLGTKKEDVAWILSLLQLIIVSIALYKIFGQNGLIYVVFWLMSVWYLVGGLDNGRNNNKGRA
jgi:hypothetical protein